MTILVTGSAGHLGEALMRVLRAQGRAAPGIDRIASPFTDHVGSIGDRDFADTLRRLRNDEDLRSALARETGVKGYHGERWRDELYPVG